ncbi:MAG: hypothetical protein K2G09_00700 [Paramuribaculum sp.]|nr:hypothetical protein [Paramuribaculum sp.]
MDKKVKLTENHPDWKGYDIDELRYQQAYTEARLEIEKERMSASARSIYSSTAMTRSGGLIGRILGSLNYVDYAIIAFRIFKKARGLMRRR